MTDTVRKTEPRAPAGFFEAEAAGLRWLAEADGARVVRVISSASDFIELERVYESAPSAQGAREFGRALARTHSAGAPAFGARPDGYQGPMFIGSRPMPAGTDSSWGRFYGENRVRPFLDVAVHAGNLTLPERDTVLRACSVVEHGAFDDDEPPSRIHGDLWTGNVLWDETGAILIDPAAHGGHRETDLAMLALFGCPHLADVIVGYQEEHPLVAGWERRIPIHQLHPLAVHAAGHGRAYGKGLTDAASRTLEAAGHHA